VALQLLMLSFFVSAIGCFLLVRYQHLHGRFTLDHTEGGPQKMHVKAVPRVGGVPIVLALGVCVVFLHALGSVYAKFFALMFICLIPSFVTGVAEDMTKRIGPLARLLATFASAALAFWLFDARITRFDLPLLDLLVSASAVSFLATLVCAGGVAHSVNIIDGLNGLAAMIAVFALAALAYVCFKLSDTVLMYVCLATIGGVLGFLVWNYPFGTIFLGDGGAYSLGFIIATVSVLLVGRHPNVSAWFPLLLVAYPVWETLFSAYRRKRDRKPATQPDAQHLHTLLYKRIGTWLEIGKPDYNTQRHAMASAFLWGFSLSTIVPALLFWDNRVALLIAAAVFIALYHAIYYVLSRGIDTQSALDATCTPALETSKGDSSV
jgi:UDP-GlcNAc:undecaprenyl-phosphate/decaprenyl-phosphate GlcNAc-1-phosphate transferase